jgi:hypothetical protein
MATTPANATANTSAGEESGSSHFAATVNIAPTTDAATAA